MADIRSNKGIWSISQGKGDRMYIQCTNHDKIIHQLDNINGLGIYGYEHLKDLALAILLFDLEKQKSESIIGVLENLINLEKEEE